MMWVWSLPHRQHPELRSTPGLGTSVQDIPWQRMYGTFRLVAGQSKQLSDAVDQDGNGLEEQLVGRDWFYTTSA